MMRIASEIGWVKNTEGSPWLIESARRNCCSAKRPQDQPDHGRCDRHVEHAHAEADQADDP